MEVGLSRRDAERVMGDFDLESFGLARCFLKAHGVQVSQRLRNAMSSSRWYVGIVYPAAELPLRALGFLKGAALELIQSLLRELLDDLHAL